MFIAADTQATHRGSDERTQVSSEITTACPLVRTAMSY
jgi:hypothetical protein